jgi:predicted esterase
MRYPFTIISLLGITSIFAQQQKPVRYLVPVFAETSIEKNISYATTLETGKNANAFLLDIYQPKGDTMIVRPLIIWMHGGGFKFGRKTSRATPLWSKTFAQRGYVCAAINYRLSKKKPLSNFADLADGCLMAMEDLNLAIQFLKAHAKEYRIDSNKIILAGNSAGGMVALQSVYCNYPALCKMAGRPDSVINKTTYQHPRIAAIISCWGAIYDTSWIQNASVPIVCIHGSKDRVVPYLQKNSFYGSAVIHRIANAAGIPNDLKIFEGYGHELQKHFNPLFYGGGARKRWLTAGAFAADFLYKQLYATTR